MREKKIRLKAELQTEPQIQILKDAQIEIEAGLRSPLHNPASTDGRQKTTELKLVSK